MKISESCYSTPMKQSRKRSATKQSSPLGLKSLSPVSKQVDTALTLNPKQCSALSREEVLAWLDQIDLSYLLNYPHPNYLRDPTRNGVLIAKIAEFFLGSLAIKEEPSNIEEVRENFRLAMNAFVTDNKSLPDIALRYPDGLINGWEDCLWGYLESLAQQYPYKAKNMYKLKHIPYSSYQIKALRVNLMSWLNSLKLLSKDIRYFEDLVNEIKEGKLLSQIVSKVMNKPVPWLGTDKLNGIEKCLIQLREEPRMSIQFIWSAQSIAEGDQGYILGLLEDLHRLFDNSPTRPRQKYFRDNPYFGDEANNKYSKLIDSNAILNAYKRFKASIKKSKSIDISHLKPPKIYHPFYWLKSDITVDPRPPAIYNPVVDKQSFNWLERIGLKVPKDINKLIVQSFQDGNLLCRIVETLERKPVDGIIFEKNTAAEQYQKIKKALAVVVKKPYFCEVFNPVEIQEGKGETVRGLLNEIYRAYKSTIFVLDRTKAYK